MAGPAPPTPIEAGRLLGGRYRLRVLIARGGMAEVWEGHDDILSRPVAVKVLRPHLAADEVFLERFRREAVTAARLAHPGVVATFDTGIDGGTAYIVMELVHGQTLRQYLGQPGRSGPLDPAIAVSIAGQIADALAYAHRFGLVHRDVKPANVLLCDDDWGALRVKVTDFGIAKASEGLGGDLTRTGMVLGTPKYLSPEQIEGREPDARADLYALGVVLYEMLVGEPPFSGPTDMATAIAHLHDAPPRVSFRRPGIPPELDQLVAELLSKDVAARPVSGVVLRQRLVAIAAGLPAANGHAPTTWTGPPTGPINGLATMTIPTPGPATGVTPPLSATTQLASGRTATTVLPDSGRQTSAPPPAGDRVPGSSGPTDPGPPRRRRRSRRGPGIVVLVLVVTGAIVAAVLLRPQPSHPAAAGTSPTTARSSTPVAIAKVSVFMNVTGHSADDSAATPNTFDGNPNTFWSTDTYRNATFGNLYPGIGLAIQLSSGRALHRLVVTTTTRGWAAQTYVSTSDIPTGSVLSLWGQPTDTQTGISGSATFDLKGRSGSWVLLWLTNLGPHFRAQVDELSVS